MLQTVLNELDLNSAQKRINEKLVLHIDKSIVIRKRMRAIYKTCKWKNDAASPYSRN